MSNPQNMETYKITATSYHDLKSQLYSWESHPKIQINTPEADISKALATARIQGSKAQQCKVDLTLALPPCVKDAGNRSDTIFRK